MIPRGVSTWDRNLPEGAEYIYMSRLVHSQFGNDHTWFTHVEFVELCSNALRTNTDTLPASNGTWKKYLLDRVHDTAIMRVNIGRELRYV